MEMTLAKTASGFDFYYGFDHGQKVFDIVPQGQKKPIGGYHDVASVANMRKVPIATATAAFA